MENKKVIGIFAIALVLVLAVSLVSAFGNGFGNKMSEEERAQIKEAVESGDYEAWSEIKRAQISEDKFNEARARHNQRAEYRAQIQEARVSGDYERLQELKAEFGSGKGMHKKNMNIAGCLKA